MLHEQLKLAAGELPQKERADQNRKGCEAEAEAAVETEGDNQRNRQMNSKHPLPENSFTRARQKPKGKFSRKTRSASIHKVIVRAYACKPSLTSSS